MTVHSTPAPAHVVMLVANDVTTDSRVRKTALTAARLGLRVTVVAYSPDPRHDEESMGPVRIVRVPVPWRLLERRRAHTALNRSVVRVDRMSAANRQADLVRLHVRRRELDSARAARRTRGGRLTDPLQDAVGALRERRLMGTETMLWGLPVLQRKLDGVTRRARRVVLGFAGRAPVGIGWRRVLPELDDYELAYGPVVDALEPDLIHAHDVQMLGVAFRASARARLRGRTVPWLYDAHEYVRGLSQYGRRTARVVASWAAAEKQWIREADHVVTVSPGIAELLRKHYKLARPPAVVLNAPTLRQGDVGSRGVRAAAGLADDVPLLVYSGGMTAARGVDTVVGALPRLPGVHLALVPVPAGAAYVDTLVGLARSLGVADRLHVVGPVQPSEVVAFLSSATAGVVPLRHFGSHELALTNKLFEYLHARLPVLVSDCRTQAAYVQQHGLGEVFTAGDPASLARAAEMLLGRLDHYAPRQAVGERLRQEHSWEAQESVLAGVYSALLGRTVDVPDTPFDPALIDQETRDLTEA